jgi:U4/U6 small nuclear ribonucleoprotein PRP31
MTRALRRDEHVSTVTQPPLHTTMSGLADELLADLEGLSDDAGDYSGDENAAGPSTTSAPAGNGSSAVDNDAGMSDAEEGEGADEEQAKVPVGGLVADGGVRPAEELDAEDVQQMELGNVEDVSNVAKLYGSRRMADILKVRNYVLMQAYLPVC